MYKDHLLTIRFCIKQSMETVVYNSLQALFDPERAMKGATTPDHSFCRKQSMNLPALFDAEKAMNLQQQA